MRMPRLTAVALAGALAITVGACDSDDEDSSSTSDAPSSETTAGSTDESPSGGEATGDPIEIMNISTLESANFSAPQVEAALDSAVEALNANGGINGRPVEVTFCNDQFDANAGAACARQAVDGDFVAVVGSLSTVFPSIEPVLEEGGVPWIGGLASQPAELQSPISYPFHSGASSMTASLGRFFVDNDAPNVAIITGDDAGSLAIAGQVEPGIEAGGGTLVANVSGANGHPDWTAEVATALDSDPDAVAYFGTLTDAPKVITALRQAGFEGLIGTPGSLLTPANVDALGDDAEDVYAAFRIGPPFDRSNPEVARFQDELGEHSPDTPPDEIGLNAWTALQLFKGVVGQIEGDITAESVVDAFDNLSEPVELGVAPDYIPQPDTPPNPDLPRARQIFAVVAQVQDGDYVSQGDFFNPFEE